MGIRDGLPAGASVEIGMNHLADDADAFDAMMSDRHYRRRLSLIESKWQLTQGAGTQFDAEVVGRFMNVLDNDQELRDRLELNEGE